MPMTREEIEQQLATIHSQENPGEGAQLDPATLAILLQVLMSVVGGCLKQKTPAQIAEYATRHPILARRALAKAVEKAKVPAKDRPAALRTLFAAAQDATPEAVAALAS